jgi:hypothetical protein
VILCIEEEQMLTTTFWPWIGFNAFVPAMLALNLEVF